MDFLTKASVPTFFIIGAPKCGTTAMYDVLKQHPEIFMSPVKEPHFFTFEGTIPIFKGPGGGYFNKVAVTRPLDYLKLFAGAQSHKAIGEASPSYLRSSCAAARIFRSFPKSRIIALLRQPAERAYSHFQYLRFHGVEPLRTFEEALQNEVFRRQDGWSSIHFYRQGGFYFDNVKRYYDLFPRDQIRVYLYEEWNHAPEAVLKDIFHFLGVEPLFLPEIRRSNVTFTPRIPRINSFVKNRVHLGQFFRFLPASVDSAIMAGLQLLNKSCNLYPPPPINPYTWKELTEGYREDITKLQELLDRDLTHWLNR